MSTRGYIGILNEDGSVDAIYNHFDSYFERLGRDLIRCFNSKEKIQALIKRGGGSYILDKEGYKNENKLKHCDSEEDFFEILNSGIDFAYLWKDNKWYVKSYHFCEPQPLIQIIYTQAAPIVEKLDWIIEESQIDLKNENKVLKDLKPMLEKIIKNCEETKKLIQEYVVEKDKVIMSTIS